MSAGGETFLKKLGENIQNIEIVDCGIVYLHKLLNSKGSEKIKQNLLAKTTANVFGCYKQLLQWLKHFQNQKYLLIHFLKTYFSKQKIKL